MANYRGHLAGGIIGGLVFAGFVEVLPLHLRDAQLLLTNWQVLGGIVALSTLFGIFPDVDTNSKAQDLFFALAFVLDITLIYYGLYVAAAYLGMIAMTPIVGKHRGWTHNKLAMFLVPAPLLVIPYLSVGDISQTALIMYGASTTGYFTHLLLDGLIFKRFRIKN